MRERWGFLLAIVALFGGTITLSLMPAGSTGTIELLSNPSFEEWDGGLPRFWQNVTDPGAMLEASDEAVDGIHSIRLMNVESNDVHLVQNVTIPEGMEGSVQFSLWCRIEDSEDIDAEGVHSPTGLEIGLEGGDVDGDSFDEYLYLYYYVDDDVRPEDFTVLAGIYNTTEGVEIHKVALLFPLETRGTWQYHTHNLSQIFLTTLGGLPRGEYRTMLWALRWGDGRRGVGIEGFVDGMSLRCAVSESPRGAGLPCILLLLALPASRRVMGCVLDQRVWIMRSI